MSRSVLRATVCLVPLVLACSEAESTACEEGKVRQSGLCVSPQPGAGIDDTRRDGGGGTSSGMQEAGLPDAMTMMGMDASLDAGMADASPAADAGVFDASIVDAGSAHDGAAGNVDAGQDGGAFRCESICDPSLDDACAPAPELSCNGKDDNCDGVTDEGLAAFVGAATEWSYYVGNTLTEMADDQRGMFALLPRPAGGAYVLSKAVASLDGASPITASRLDAQGALVGAAQTGILPSSRFFLADSYGSYLAVVYFVSDADGVTTEPDGTTRLALLEEKANGALETLADIAVYEANGDIAALSLNAAENGQLRVLLAMADARDNGSNSTGTSAPWLQTFRYDPEAGQKLQSITGHVEVVREEPLQIVEDGGPSVRLIASSTTVRLQRKPCAAGWLMTQQDPPSGVGSSADRELFLREVSSDGDLDMDGPALWRGGKGFSSGGLGVDARCDGATSRVLVAIGDSSTLYAHELVWNNAQGTVTEPNPALAVGAAPRFAKILPQGGSWLVSTWTRGVSPALYELDFVHETSRALTLPFDVGILSWLDVRDVHMYYAPVLGLVQLKTGVMVSFTNGSPASSLLGRDTLAVSALLGCAP